MTSAAESRGRVAFQGEHGAFSEAAAIQLLGEGITTVPRATFDSAFRAIAEGAADALLAPVENTLAGSVMRVYDLLLESNLNMVAETILPIEHHVIGVPGATLEGLRSVASHPMALAQCEKFFLKHPGLKRVPAEDTAGSVRDALAKGDKTAAGIAGRYAATRYGGAILAESIQDNAENFTRFVLLIPASPDGSFELFTPSKQPRVAELMQALSERRSQRDAEGLKMSLAFQLAHRPGALLAALEPFSRHGVNLQKIESRPIHGSPWEYQFFLDVQTTSLPSLQAAISEVQSSTSFLHILGLYPPAAESR
ncbi:MAG TPA: prephenate dehydratase [Dongiaceae bacterium]|nr:prephenate dehydratase [Dongiaceae bacterium]